uniref:Uncharacterized protein n=1 Tax=Rhizophora mucronata TaxID=61149 RepID=A0A2P2N7B8_RHIMU
MVQVHHLSWNLPRILGFWILNQVPKNTRKLIN